MFVLVFTFTSEDAAFLCGGEAMSVTCRAAGHRGSDQFPQHGTPTAPGPGSGGGVLGPGVGPWVGGGVFVPFHRGLVRFMTDVCVSVSVK